MNLQNQSPRWRPVLQGGLMVLLVWLAYFPSLRGDFLWDDDDNITENWALRSLSGLRRIWVDPGATQQYYPLTHSSFWLEYHLWGLHPAGYHAVNILLHAASGILLWQLLRRLRVPGAWLGAALFALHPVNVESVTWITERKNNLSGVFFLLSLLASLKFWLPAPADSNAMTRPAGQNKGFGPGRFYWFTFLLYLCALWAKTATIGLPAVILLIAWWNRRKIGRRDLLLLVPFAVIGVALGLITRWIETGNGGASGKEWDFSLGQRVLLAGRIFWFYPGKLIWPHPLMFMYPHWTIHVTQPVAYLPDLAAAGFIALLWRKRDGWARPVLLAVGCYVAILFPVMGFFNVYFFRYSFVCDHFPYLAMMAPLALAAAGITWLSAKLGPRLGFILPVCVLLPLGLLANRQTGIYRNSETLWRDSMEHNPASWIAINNLGVELGRRGEFAAAAALYRRAFQLNPDGEYILHNLGIEAARTGDFDTAMDYYRKALLVKPNFADAHINFGNALDAKGDLKGAAEHYYEAGRIDPNSFNAFYNLGNELVRLENAAGAIPAYRHALQLQPGSAGAHKNLGIALAMLGHLDEAFGEFARSMEIDPVSAEIHFCMGRLMAQHGNKSEARAQFREALRLQPDHAAARRELDALEASDKVPGLPK